MIKIINNIIPFKGFTCMMIWPFLFIRKDSEKYLSLTVENHEKIHSHQQAEMFIVGCILTALLMCCKCGWLSIIALPIFFWWYLIEWLMRYITYGDATESYRNISFESEAYSNQNDIAYCQTRKPFHWLSYL